MLKLLSCSIILLIIISCTKEKIARMDRGKYKVTHICNFPNGQLDTFEFRAFGPYIGKKSYFFHPSNTYEFGDIEIYKIDKKHKQKEYNEIKVFLNQSLVPYFGYYYAKIDSYTIEKRGMLLHYSEHKQSNNKFIGTIQLQWIEP